MRNQFLHRKINKVYAVAQTTSRPEVFEKMIKELEIVNFKNTICDSTLQRQTAAKEILILCDHYEVSSEIIHELAKHNMRVIEVPIKARYDERSVKKGTNIREGINIFIGILLKRLGLKK